MAAMTTTMSGNEAELQAKLEARIRDALPLLPAEINLEHHLHLRLGHHHVVIDGSTAGRNSVAGRYDVLVSVAGTPLLIAELKAPNVAIEDDDVRQALSYARLHEPMVPLVLVTNGVTRLLRRTYDNSDLDPSDIAAERLNSILSATAAIAASSSEDAVRALLGASTATWAQILSKWTAEAVVEITGSIRDFRFPIGRELSIPRKAARELEDYLAAGARVLVLHGPPLSGVTNTLAQFAHGKTLRPTLFLDGAATPDVLQFIANRLSRELSFTVSKDDLRGWCNTGRGLVDLTLVIDGVPLQGVDELVENAKAGLLRLVLGMTSETQRASSTVGGRIHQSLLGRTATMLELLPMSDEEFFGAMTAFEEAFKAVFFNGVQHVPEMRWPRSLRVVAATLPNTMPVLPEPNGSVTRGVLLPIPGPHMLEECSRAFGSDPMLKVDLQKLAAAFIADAANHVADPDWLVATWGRPSIHPDLLEDLLGERRLERLQGHGLVSWIEIAGLGPRLLVRLEELMAHHVAELWARELALSRAHDRVESELERLLELSIAVPLGDVALAAAIFRASKKEATVLDVAIPHLLHAEPTTARLTEGAEVALFVMDRRVRLRFGEGMDEEVVGNIQPWLVLSHLASWPMSVDGHKQTANFSILATLGMSRHFLYAPKPTTLRNVPAFHFHDLKEIGRVPCLKTGIVEPLLQAMVGHAHNFPEEFVLLANLAMERKEAHLAWRVLTVAIASETSTERDVHLAAAKVKEVLGNWWGNALREIFEQHGDA